MVCFSNDQKLKIGYLLCGIGMLTPYNATYGAVDYFQTLLDDSVMYYLAVSLTFPQLLMMFGVLFGGTPSNMKGGIIFGYCIMLVGIIMICFVSQFWFIILAGCIISVGTALVQGLYLTTLGCLPGEYTFYFFSGVAFSGLIVLIARIIMKGIISNLYYSALTYFILAICFVMYSMHVTSSWIFSNPEYLKYQTKDNNGNVQADEESSLMGRNDIPTVSTWNLICQIWPYVTTIVLNYIITLILFPGMVSNFSSQYESMAGGWYTIILFTLFGLFDFLIRFILPYVPTVVTKLNPYTMLLLTCTRLAFVPLFYMICGGMIKSDALGYILVILFAASNGYFGTIAPSNAPNAVKSSELKARVGTLNGFFICVGLNGGAIAAAVVKSFGLIPDVTTSFFPIHTW